MAQDVGLDWIGLDWIGLDWIGCAAHDRRYVRTVNEWIHSPNSKEQLRIRLYIPEVPAGQEVTLPILFYTHSGGMAIGAPEMDEAMLMSWAKEIPALIASPDYRLSPEHTYPAQVLDSFHALQWVAGVGAKKYSADANRIGLGGASAGGTLALALGLLANDFGSPKIRAILTIYPMLDEAMSTASCRAEFDSRFVLNPQVLSMLWHHYRGSYTGGSKYFDPFNATDYRGMPPVFGCSGTVDPLHDPIDNVVQRMRNDGVAAEFRSYPGVGHNFDCMPIKIAQQARSDWLNFLKKELT